MPHEWQYCPGSHSPLKSQRDEWKLSRWYIPRLGGKDPHGSLFRIAGGMNGQVSPSKHNLSRVCSKLPLSLRQEFPVSVVWTRWVATHARPRKEHGFVFDVRGGLSRTMLSQFSTVKEPLICRHYLLRNHRSRSSRIGPRHVYWKLFTKLHHFASRRRLWQTVYTDNSWTCHRATRWALLPIRSIIASHIIDGRRPIPIG